MMKAANYDLRLDTGWKFCLGEAKRFSKFDHSCIYSTAKAGGALGDKKTFLHRNVWREVRIPHDWLTEAPYDPDAAASSGYKKRGKGWYHCAFSLPSDLIERATLIFEGVLGVCTVYVNGMIAARNFSGYNRFTAEIASYLLPGEENMIALSVDATEWEGWSYEGAGLYRPVRIAFRDAVSFEPFGAFVRGRLDNGAWMLDADLALLGDASCFESCTVCSELSDGDGTVIGRWESPAESEIHLSLPVSDPLLWSPEAPNLYRYRCELLKNGAPVDAISLSVGFRDIRWCKDTGMLLGGQPYTVKGVCCHQDHGGVGAAVTESLMEYRIRRLKEFGVNAYRCAHHAPSETLLDICDRLGMLVMVENRHFSVSKDVLFQLDALVLLARNHPCVFIYSLFNEEPWQAERRGYLMAREMRERVLSLDDTRAVTGAMNGGTLKECNASDALDVVGMNYGLAKYEDTHLRSPEKAILGTENCPTYATRGVYTTDSEAQVFSAYGDEWAKLFSESMTETMECVEKIPYNAGCFVWSGFDAYGEPNPHLWPSVMSHWGMLDICGFAKDTAYLLAAWYKSELTVHLLPHWNHTEGETVRVCAFTNADTAELFVNGRSAGTLRVEARRAEWTVPFERGKIRVLARRGDEEEWDEITTVDPPARLVLTDVTPTNGVGDIRILNVSVTDESGRIVPDFCAPVTFELRSAEILGVANGDPNGLRPNKGTTTDLYHGRAQLIVSAEKGRVTAYCDGLPDAVAVLL